MRATTTSGLNSKYLQNLSFYNYLAAMLALLVTVFSVFWMLFHQSDRSTGFVMIGISILVVIISSFWALLTAQRMRFGRLQLERPYQLSWLLIGLGLLSTIFGRPCIGLLFTDTSSFFYQAWILVPNLFYPLVFVGLLLLPGSPRLRASVLFDALITVLCLVSLAWSFVTTVPSLPPAQSFTSAGLLLFYPACDVFLLLLLALQWRRGIELPLRFPLLLLGAGMLAITWADLAGSYLHIFAMGYKPGTASIDTFCLIGTLLLGLAGPYQYTALVRKIHTESFFNSGPVPNTVSLDSNAHRYEGEGTDPRWNTQAMYVPLALLLYLLIFTTITNNPDTREGFIAVGALVSALIVIRHFSATKENNAFLQEREQHYLDTERVRHLVMQLSDIRDMDQLRARILKTMLTEFGFTFAMLLLLDNHNETTLEQPHLLASTASISAHPTKWKLRGDTILYRTVCSGKRTLITWGQQTTESIPVEVRLWLEKLHVPSMQFFPIIYQGRILGSLGVARHALAQRMRSDTESVGVYTEELAAVLEHAYLYREAREREAFAQAMANISTRLNAAVVGTIEISQQICEEGASALRADYVILYVAREDEQMEPLAGWSNDKVTAAPAQDWPSFPLWEYEAETNHALHPILLDVTQRRRTPGSKPALNENGAPPQEHHGRRAFSLRPKLARHFIQTAILAPLVAGGNLIGLLIFARATPPGSDPELCFEESDLSYAQDFVKQASVAFANARLYQHLQLAHKQLKELDQLKDQFMITASHELRTPLTAVQGYIELIAQYDEILPPEQRREFLQKAQLGCEELAVLLRNVMDASRLEAEAGIRAALLSRVSVLSMIEKVQVMIEPQVTHQGRQIYAHIPQHLYVLADPVRLHQVLMNISTNALKYSPPRSPISFTARIHIDQGSYIIISIADKGKGIAQQDQERLFQRFYRLERDLNSPVRGSGLGLYISRRLIEAMGGKIWIESTGIPGEGSTFHIQLPMA